eukprot:1437655-Prymnesium_polylepis.1
MRDSTTLAIPHVLVLHISRQTHEKYLDTGPHLLRRGFLQLAGVGVGVLRRDELDDARHWLLAVGIGDLPEPGLGLLEGPGGPLCLLVLALVHLLL